MINFTFSLHPTCNKKEDFQQRRGTLTVVEACPAGSKTEADQSFNQTSEM